MKYYSINSDLHSDILTIDDYCYSVAHSVIVLPPYHWWYWWRRPRCSQYIILPTTSMIIDIVSDLLTNDDIPIPTVLKAPMTIRCIIEGIDLMIDRNDND